MNSQEKTKELLSLLKEKVLFEKNLKELNKKIMAIISNLYDYMEDEEISKITIEDIEFKRTIETNFSLNGKLKGKKWDEILEFHNWLREIGEDGLIKPTVPWNTRLKFLKEWVEDDNDLPDFIKQDNFGTVKYNKSAVKRLIEN